MFKKNTKTGNYLNKTNWTSILVSVILYDFLATFLIFYLTFLFIFPGKQVMYIYTIRNTMVPLIINTHYKVSF